MQLRQGRDAYSYSDHHFVAIATLPSIRNEGTTFLISTHNEKIASLCRRQIVAGDGLVTG